jgi:hypothetical protein
MARLSDVAVDGGDPIKSATMPGRGIQLLRSPRLPMSDDEPPRSSKRKGLNRALGLK